MSENTSDPTQGSASGATQGKPLALSPVNDLSELLPAVQIARTTFKSNLWFRGQPNAVWKLIPSVFRRNGGYHFEANTIRRFAQLARSRHQPCPPVADVPGWLFLMQHHRVPTRLLDWSESPLAALWFACETPYDTAGVLWVLAPFRLNAAHRGKTVILSSSDEVVKDIMTDATKGTTTQQGDRVLAIIADEVDIRMLLQLAAFTIHNTQCGLDDDPKAETFLAKMLISGARKKSLRDQLWALGIRRSTLFPDLDNLAAELSEYTYEALD